MHAVVCHSFGPIDRLRVEEHPDPAMVPGGVRVAVRAAGISFADDLVVNGSYQRKPAFPFVPGMPVAGVVTEVADGVERVRPGDRVFAALDNGAWAEQAVAHEAQVFRIPDAMDFETAIAFPFTYGTSYGALTWCARLRAGETLLVHGAASGVGLAAVEIGRAVGARVIATAGGPDRAAVAAAHGAHVALDHRAGPFRDAVLAATGGQGADVVFDPVGGPVFDQSLRATAPEGRIAVIGFAGGTHQQVPANLLLVKNVSVIGFFWANYRKNHPRWVEAAHHRMFRWWEEGRIRPTSSHVFPLEGFAEAMRVIRAREVVGKVVLRIGG